MEHIVFLTGRLAEPNLVQVLKDMDDAPFTWEVREIGLQVAGLMTADMIRRRVAAPVQAGRMLVPGRCRGDLDELSRHYGIPVQRGPEELKDLPRFFDRQARPVDLTRRDILVFAEIVEAPHLDVPAIVARAQALRRDGADVIDLGGLPATPFPQLEDAVRRTGEALARLQEENDRLRRDHRRLEDEKKHVVAQIDAILRDIAKLDLERPANG